MKRFLVVLAAAGAVMAAATPALAAENDNNCVGSKVSGVTPDVVQGGQQGANASRFAGVPGGRADFVQDFFQTFCPGFPG